MKGEKYLRNRVESIDGMNPIILPKVMIRAAIIVVLVLICIFTCNSVANYFIDHPGYEEEQYKREQLSRIRIAHDYKHVSDERVNQVEKDYDKLTWRQLRKVADSIQKSW